MNNKHRLLIAALSFVAIFASACQAAPATQTPTSAAPQEEQTAAPTPDALLVSSLRDVRKAVIMIQANGAFFDVGGNAQSDESRGSGFIIHPSGIAVTNNHVVTGAAYLDVYLDGESKPRSAKILGVSECSDLAVIDIEGDGFHYLDWYPGVAEVGLEIYVAGFPLGDPNYALKKGIVARVDVDGDSQWASVRGVIEHDAQTLDGNSGGPLVTSDGRVIGVHFARNNAGEKFAIDHMAARDVVTHLREGVDLDSLGINGEAFAQDGLSGIFVRSVQSGSIADKAGLEGGDVIWELENRPAAPDGTMRDYCKVLRGHDLADALRVKVLRMKTETWLEGQFNSRPLVALATPTAVPTPTMRPTSTPRPQPTATARPVDPYLKALVDTFTAINSDACSSVGPSELVQAEVKCLYDDLTVYYHAFRNNDDMDSYVRKLFNNDEDFYNKFLTWWQGDNKHNPLGYLWQYKNNENNAVLLWTLTERSMVGIIIASDGDRDKVYDWWSKVGSIIR